MGLHSRLFRTKIAQALEDSTSLSSPRDTGRATGRLILGALVIFALVLIVYRPILPGSFLMDDRRLIQGDNPLVNGELGPLSIWFRADFPLSTLALWAQHAAWGNNPGWYHAVNMLLHALSAVLLWRVLVRLKIPGAWLAAAVYAVHPVCVNSVARIAEVKNTLSLPFFLLSLWLYLPSHNLNLNHNPSFRYALSLIAFILALLAKTSTIMLPVVLLACAVWQSGRLTRRDVLRAGPFFVIALAFGLMSSWFQKHQAMTGPALAPESFWQQLAMSGRIFWFYLGKALLPVKLNLAYPQWATAANALAYLPDFLFCVVLIVCWQFRRTWGRHVLFGLGVFAITLFPALGFFDSQFLTKWLVSDHLQYLPLIAPVTLIAAGMACLFSTAVFRGTAVAVVLGLSVLTFQRARVFASEENLFRDTIAKNPAAWGVQNDYGVILAARGDYLDAQEHFEASLRTKPDYSDAQSNLGQLLAIEGRLQQAEEYFQESLRNDPDNPETHRRFARVLAAQRRIPEALGHLRAYLALSPKPDIKTRLEYAALLHQTGDLRGAVAELRQVIQSQPDSVEALNHLAWILATASDDTVRDGAAAVHYAEKAAQLPPVKGLCVAGTLAAAYAEAGRFPEAVAMAEKAVKEATSTGEMRFVTLNEHLLTLYRVGKPFHEPPPNRENQ